MDIGGVVFIWLLLAVGVGLLADSRGRSGFGFFLLAVALSPLLGLVIVLVTQNLAELDRRQQEQRREHERQLESIKAIAGVPSSPERRTAAAFAAAKGLDPQTPDAVIHRMMVEAGEVAPVAAAAPSRQAFVGDELQKLANLVDRGLLTKDEFDQQKAALLHGRTE